MRRLIARFLQDESGATLIEYGLMASLIGIAIMGALQAAGSKPLSTLSPAAR